MSKGFLFGLNKSRYLLQSQLETFLFCHQFWKIAIIFLS